MTSKSIICYSTTRTVHKPTTKHLVTKLLKPRPYCYCTVSVQTMKCGNHKSKNIDHLDTICSYFDLRMVLFSPIFRFIESISTNDLTRNRTDCTWTKSLNHPCICIFICDRIWCIKSKTTCWFETMS